MEKRKLGKTDMELSTLSFGASSLGGVFHDIDQSEAVRTVHEAVDNGMNFIDVSPYYGYTKAETVLGKALKTMDRSSYYLSTKVGRFGLNNENHWDYSAKRTMESIDESLTRMNVDYVDILNVHDVEFSDVNQVINETLPTLQKIVEQGKARYVGITGLPLELLQKVIKQVGPGVVDSILSFCHYSINDDALLDYVPFFKENNVGVINASPLSMGLLSHRGAPAWHPAPQELLDACKKAADFCESKGERIEKLAIQYSIAHPDITTTLVSSAKPKNILENIKWANEPINLELLEEVKEILKPVHRLTWENS
nr:aldo/keto reductase [uncultured Marinifilum sp.]